MDKIKRIFSAVVCIICFISCDQIKVGDDRDALPKSSGKFGEVLVVVDTFYENRSTGKALEQIFYKALVGLPQQEPQFRMSTVSSKAFQSILKRSRNILKLNIGKGKKTAINIKEDVWAKDQLMLQITAASDDDAARILTKNTQTIRDYFNEREIDRLKKQYSGKPQKELQKEIAEKLMLSLTVPPGFVKMSETENGIWLKKEKSVGEHIIMQGVMIYTMPYESNSTFASNKMILDRNEFTRENIQGSLSNSFMTVYEDYTPDTTEINLNGIYSIEYRGLWNMKNDFMGGPFLHYTLVDEEGQRVINLDGFVYAPKFNKREYLRELEALMKTIKVK